MFETKSTADVLLKLKELKEFSKEIKADLENSGMPITDLNKERLFESNIKNTINAIESLLRNEASEKPTLRLQQDIPDAYKNIKELKTTPEGRMHSAKLERLQNILKFFEENYEYI